MARKDRDASLRRQAALLFHSPADVDRQLALLRQDNPRAIEIVICFLEADPFFYRSGYIKERLLRYIKRAPLSEEQRARLRQVLLAQVDSGGGREFRAYCRLARVIHTPKLCEELERRLEASEEMVAVHARWMLDAIEQTLPKTKRGPDCH